VIERQDIYQVLSTVIKLDPNVRKARVSPPVNWNYRHPSPAGDMTAESDEKVEIIKTENIVTVTMDAAEEIQEDNAAEAQDYFKENYSSELAQVEAFLDENPDFFKDYLIRKASRHMIDSWLVAHSLPPGHCLPISPKSGSSTPHTRSLSTGSRSTAGSGGATPIRKISAQEFEKGGLTKPWVTTVDGTPTFLTQSNNNNSELTGQIRKKSRTDLQSLDETELILELVKDICNELDVRTLCHKILQNVGILTDADRCSLFLVGGDSGTNSQYLESNLFDVSSRSTVEEVSKNVIRIKWGVGIVGHVAQTGVSCNVSDCYQDARFNSDIDHITGYKTKTMMCSPIKDQHGAVIGVAQVINKNNDGYFSDHDCQVFEKYLQFCGLGLRNAQIYERSQLEVKRNQVLLDLAGVIFQEQSTLEIMINRILTHILSFIQCERAMVLLVHDGSQSTFSRVYELDQSDLTSQEIDLTSMLTSSASNDKSSTSGSGGGQSRFPVNVGITGYVATTGETVNIADAYSDSRFDVSVDEGVKFKHKTVLSMPIKYSSSPGRVLGVFQLVNKLQDLPFTSNDENFLEAFAIFCGMGITNVRMYETACEARAKQQVTLEVLSYHAIAPLDEAIKLSRQKVPSAATLQLHSFQFDDFSLKDTDMLKASLRMFTDLDLINRFNIDYFTLCRWLCSVRRNYRSVTYHNWRHAFNVCQLMFSIITNTTWWKQLGEIECLSLVIACLCHDLDHRGTNNSYQIKSSNNLARLYSTSTMEHHHFDQCLMLLSSNGNQLLTNVSKEEFKSVILLVEEAILATDLAIYFKNRGETFSLITNGSLSWSNQDHKKLIRGLLMTACDLGAITKPWDIQQKIATLVSDEFFYQGDLEKQELQMSPIPMMDRDYKDKLPAMQVEFIDQICMPVYHNITNLSDSLKPMLTGCQKNRENWSSLIEVNNENNSDDAEKVEK